MPIENNKFNYTSGPWCPDSIKRMLRYVEKSCNSVTDDLDEKVHNFPTCYNDDNLLISIAPEMYELLRLWAGSYSIGDLDLLPELERRTNDLFNKLKK